LLAARKGISGRVYEGMIDCIGRQIMAPFAIAYGLDLGNPLPVGLLEGAVRAHDSTACHSALINDKKIDSEAAQQLHLTTWLAKSGQWSLQFILQ